MTFVFFLYLALFPLLIASVFKLNETHKKFFVVLCFLQLFFFYAFRSFEVGKDTLSYINTFKGFESNYLDIYSFTHYETGFKFMYMLLKYFNAGDQWVLIVSGALIHLSVGVFIYKNSKNIALSTFLYTCLFFPNSMNIVRQYIALAISIHFIYFLFKDKYLLSIVCVVIGAMFHQIVYLFLFFILLYKLKIPRLIGLSFFLVFISVIAFPNIYISFFMNMSDSANYYTGENFMVYRSFRFTTLLTVFQVFLFGYYFIKIRKVFREAELFFYFSLLNLIMGILYLRNEIFSRIYELLNIYLVLGLAQIKSNLKCYYKPIINIMIYVIPLVVLYLSITNSGNGVENYHMIF